MDKHIRNEQGAALIIVLLVLTIFTVLGLSMLSLSVNNLTAGHYGQENEAVYYVAEGGLNAATNKLKDFEDKAKDLWKAEKERRELYIRQLSEEAISECGEGCSISEDTRARFIEQSIVEQIDDYRQSAEIADLAKSFHSEGSDGEVTASVKIEPNQEVTEGFGYVIISTGVIENNKRTLERTLQKQITIMAGAPDTGGPVLPGDEDEEGPGDNGTDPGNGEDNETDPGDGDGEDSPDLPEDTQPMLPGNSAVFTESVITLVGGAEIDGNVGINSPNGSITLDGGASIVNGSAYVIQGYESTAVKVPHWMTPPTVIGHEGIQLVQPIFPTFPSLSTAANAQTVKSGQSYAVIQNGNLKIDDWRANGYVLNLTKDTAFNDIILTSNNQLNIDVGSADRSIVVDHLNVQNGNINIIGTGTLTIYVTDKITMGSGSTINGNTKQSNKVDLYLKRSSTPQTVQLGGNQKIYGSLYAESANLDFGGGGGFQGNLYTGGTSVKLNGGARVETSVLYAPSAHVELTGGGKVTGAIISSSFHGGGGTEVTYKPYTLDWLDFPVKEGTQENEDTEEPGNSIETDDGFINEGKPVEP